MFSLLTGLSSRVSRFCQRDPCFTLDEEVSAEAGLCAVIPCSSSLPFRFGMKWFKCKLTEECDDPVEIFSRNGQFQDVPNARVSPLNNAAYPGDCSIIINDLTESDSGVYRLTVLFEYRFLQSFGREEDNFSPPLRTTVSVKGTKSYNKFTHKWL